MQSSAASARLDTPTQSLKLSGDLAATADRMQYKARRAKLTANICVATTLVIGSVILSSFLYFSQVGSQQRAERQKDILELVFRQQKDRLEKYTELLERLSSTTDPMQSQALKEIFRPKNPLEPSGNNNSFSSFTNEDPFDEVIYNITSSVIRVGAVLIGIFLIQIMVSFARYYYKLSEHLSMVASLITLSGGKISDLKVIAPLLLPSNIDFGKTPKSPIEKIVDGGFGAIKELSKKIPAR